VKNKILCKLLIQAKRLVTCVAGFQISKQVEEDQSSVGNMSHSMLVTGIHTDQ
jgi:hypothetical protein